MRRLRPGSVVEYRDYLGNVTETHHVVCSHCQKGTDIPSIRQMMEKVDICRSCFKLICANCADEMARGKVCTPWEKRCEEYEAVYRQAVKEYGDLLK